MTNPQQDGIHVVGVQNSTTQEQTWFDWAGNPIASVGQAGGLSVFGDDISTFAPGSVFRPEVVLHPTGGVTLGNPDEGGASIYTGPNPPAIACRPGDLFVRSGVALTQPGKRIYECVSANTWQGVL